MLQALAISTGVLRLVCGTQVPGVCADRSSISAGLSKTVAAQKARNSNRWAVAGLLFGPLGLIAAVGMPDRHQIVYLRFLAEQQGYQPRHACGGQKGETDA